ANLTAGPGPLNVEVEVNGGQAKPECTGCYPNGNAAVLRVVTFEDGSDVTLAPVKIDFTTATGKFIPAPAYSGIWSAAEEYLPVGDGGVRVLPSPLPTPLAI